MVFPQWFKYYRTVAPRTRLEHPAAEQIQLTDVLFALSDPDRLELVEQLRQGAMTAAECVPTSPGMPKSTKSHLLKVLRESGIIWNVPHGRGRLLTLRADDLEQRFPGLLAAVLPTGDRSASPRPDATSHADS